MHYHSEEIIKDISAKAQAFRIQVLGMVYNAQTGHIGGAFSVAEIVAALYFHHLRLDPAPLLQGARLRHVVHRHGPSGILPRR
jgi:transketolase N-terminal domain/subunit